MTENIHISVISRPQKLKHLFLFIILLDCGAIMKIFILFALCFAAALVNCQKPNKPSYNVTAPPLTDENERQDSVENLSDNDKASNEIIIKDKIAEASVSTENSVDNVETEPTKPNSAATSSGKLLFLIGLYTTLML